jgi:hypothetical protein
MTAGMPRGEGRPVKHGHCDSACGEAYVRRLRAMGICDRPIALRSLQQNAYAERLIGSTRRAPLEHVVVFVERHFRRLMSSYLACFNEAGPHAPVAEQGRAGTTPGSKHWTEFSKAATV